MTDSNFYDTQPTKEYDEAEAIDGVYEDPTHVPEIDKEILEGSKDPISIKLATWLRQKVYGADVRETMARFVLWMSVLYNRMVSLGDKLTKRQDNVEKEFEKIGNKFDDVVSSATVDSEVILARNSENFGTFPTLDDRLENGEQKIVSMYPSSELITIKHNTKAYPSVEVLSWIDGFGVNEVGSEDWLGSIPETVFCKIKYPDYNTLIVTVPKDFEMKNPEINKVSEKQYLVTENEKTIEINIGVE